jgi:hypothetical protein
VLLIIEPIKQDIPEVLTHISFLLSTDSSRHCVFVEDWEIVEWWAGLPQREEHATMIFAEVEALSG